MLQLLAHEAAAGGGRIARNRQQGAEIAAAVRVVDLLEMDGVKLALGRADAAADALVRIDFRDLRRNMHTALFIEGKFFST